MAFLLLCKAWTSPRAGPISHHGATRTFTPRATPFAQTEFRRASRILAKASSCASDDDDPPLLAEARKFFSDRGVNLHRAYAAQDGSRTTSRIAVRAIDAGFAIGMFKPGTHVVIPWNEDERCYLPHHPAINAAIDAIAYELSAFGELTAYDEQQHRGTLRYLQLSVERDSSRVQITLVANAASLADDPALENFAVRLWEKYGDGTGETTATLRLHSIWANLNPTRVNNILSYENDAWRLLMCSGQEGDDIDGSLVERLPSGAAFVLPPYVFRQANMDGFDRIVEGVRRVIHPSSRVVEWYAGVGVLGLSLASHCEWVRCSDVNPPKAAFEASRAFLEPGVRERIGYRVGSAAERLEDARGANAAIVDPPRKGLDAALLEALCEPLPCDIPSPCADLQTLVYVSCGFNALARDADALLKAGWRVCGDQAMAYVLFKGANHIETLVVFERETLSDTGHNKRTDGERTVAQEPPTREKKWRSSNSYGAPTRRSRSDDTPRGRRLASKRRNGPFAKPQQ